MGIGNGTLEPGDAPVTFSWISKDSGTSGTTSAIVGANGASEGTGSTFSGPFLQVISSSRTESLEAPTTSCCAAASTSTRRLPA